MSVKWMCDTYRIAPMRAPPLLVCLTDYSIRFRLSDLVNFILTMVFLAEMAFKLGALGPIKYFTDLMNLFDATVIVLSLIELFFSSSNKLSVFRAFRLLRVLKLARYLHYCLDI